MGGGRGWWLRIWLDRIAGVSWVVKGLLSFSLFFFSSLLFYSFFKDFLNNWLKNIGEGQKGPKRI